MNLFISRTRLLRTPLSAKSICEIYLTVAPYVRGELRYPDNELSSMPLSACMLTPAKSSSLALKNPILPHLHLFKMLLQRSLSWLITSTISHTHTLLHPYFGSLYSIASNTKLLVFAFRVFHGLSPHYYHLICIDTLTSAPFAPQMVPVLIAHL